MAHGRLDVGIEAPRLFVGGDRRGFQPAEAAGLHQPGEQLGIRELHPRALQQAEHGLAGAARFQLHDSKQVVGE